MTEKTLDSQVAVITGGSRGSGREVARALAMEGAKVFLFFKSHCIQDDGTPVVLIHQNDGWPHGTTWAVDPNSICPRSQLCMCLL